MAQHDDVRPVRARFVPREGAPERGRHPEQVEQGGRRHRHRDLHGRGVLAEGEDAAEERLETDGILDHVRPLLQLDDVRSARRAALEVGDPSIVAPHVVQVLGVPVRHGIDEDLLHDREHDGEHPEADGQRGQGGGDEGGRTGQTTPHEFGVPAPIAGAPPRGRWPQPLAGPVAERVHERAQTHRAEPDAAAPGQGLPRPIAVRLDERVSHLVAEVRRVEAEQEAEPALRESGPATAAHFVSFTSSPPARAARVSSCSRRASARAARRPASVTR